MLIAFYIGFSIINLMHILGEMNGLGSSESANPMDGDGSHRVFALYDWIGYVPCFRTQALRICSTKMVIASIWIWVLRTSTDRHADQIQWQLATASP